MVRDANNLSVMRKNLQRIAQCPWGSKSKTQGELNVCMRSQSDRCRDSETSLSDVVVNPNLPMCCSFVTCGSAIEEAPEMWPCGEGSSVSGKIRVSAGMQMTRTRNIPPLATAIQFHFQG